MCGIKRKMLGVMVGIGDPEQGELAAQLITV